MSSIAIVSIVIIILFILLFAALPVFGALGLASIAGIILLQGVDGLSAIPTIIFHRMSEFTLISVPLFILMGEIIFVSGIGSDIFKAASRWLSSLRGSLGMASVAACAVFGALCGVSVAGAATIGKFAIPEMLDRGYDRRLASGCVAAAGGLALLIPPSVGLILYGLVADQSVGLLFVAGVVPGIMIALMMMAYIYCYALIYPDSVPDIHESVTWSDRWESLWRVLPTFVLIIVVLGSMYVGAATPTEAASLGAVGAAIIAIMRQKLGFSNIWHVLSQTILNTAMIMAVLASSLIFGYLLTRLRIPQELVIFVSNGAWPEPVVLFGILLLLILLGMFMDVVSVILIATPILLPTILALGYDPIWFGIAMAITCEMAVITPPVGLNLFVIKGISPSSVTLTDVTIGAAPFVGVLVLAIVLLTIFPQIALWLPFAKY